MLAFSWEFFFSFRFTRPVVEGNHSLMGGSADALHLGAVLSFFPFWPLFCLFLGFRVFLGSVVFSATPWGVSQGLGTKSMASDVTCSCLNVCLADRASAVRINLCRRFYGSVDFQAALKCSS